MAKPPPQTPSWKQLTGIAKAEGGLTRGDLVDGVGGAVAADDLDVEAGLLVVALFERDEIGNVPAEYEPVEVQDQLGAR